MTLDDKEGTAAVLDFYLASYRAILGACALSPTNPLASSTEPLVLVLKFDAAQLARGVQMLLACVSMIYAVGSQSELSHHIIGTAIGKEGELPALLDANRDLLETVILRGKLPISLCALRQAARRLRHEQRRRRDRVGFDLRRLLRRDQVWCRQICV